MYMYIYIGIDMYVYVYRCIHPYFRSDLFPISVGKTVALKNLIETVRFYESK